MMQVELELTQTTCIIDENRSDMKHSADGKRENIVPTAKTNRTNQFLQ